jgi:UDP-N-acetylmuramyl pentapeptide phosphotransferase/UDP-N-acetylglucosamine-1-phosphate transferase
LILAAVFGVSAWLTRSFTDPASFFHVLDHPNERSLHQVPVPRTGGVAMLLALAVGALLLRVNFAWPLQLTWIAAAVGGLGLVSYLEDRRGVKRRYRLLVQTVAAGLLLAGGLLGTRLELPGMSLPLPLALDWAVSLLFILWMINLYNFMDGMDGFAAGMALIGFSTLALFGWQGDDPLFALVSGLIAAAAAGFLIWNFPPARIFMGDAGSASLGLLAAALSLWGSQRGLFPIWAALLVFSPFLADATLTLMHRLVQGERIWEAHRGHHYQRLVQAGWSHRRTVLWGYALMLACGYGALRSPQMNVREQWYLLGAWAIIYALIAFRTRLLERQTGAAPS